MLNFHLELLLTSTLFYLQKALMNIQELSILELNFEGMKRILTAPNETSKQEEVNKEKREQMVKTLKEQDFDELMKHTETSVSFKNLTVIFFFMQILISRFLHTA